MSANISNVVLEEYEMLGDSKYRSFVTAVDKSLKTFEYSSEWADLISALGKLNKVLLSHMKFNMIPRRITISKRLAQCMHPALPSGVHLKALETYDIIFKSIGTIRLSQELFIYSAGLFPLLAHAAMNVKPVLLTIYETHFVALAARLRPGLNGFLIGVLPGLEEGSDYFDRTDALLQQVCEAVEQSYFYGCLWRCVLTNPSVRLPAITFIIIHYNKKLSMEDQLHVIGTDIDAMVQGMCAALQDSSVLVQRCALDLLLIGFPLHNSQLLQADMIRVVQAAIAVVLRRDMSLNRRLFAWLLGLEAANTPIAPEACSRESVTSTDSIPTVDYFDTHSKGVLLAALRLCFQGSDNFSWLLTSGVGGVSGYPSLWPYRILMSLLDRPEISFAILDDILLHVFRSLHQEIQVKHSCDNTLLVKKNTLKYGSKEPGMSPLCTELLKTANLLFGTLETSYLWEYIGRLFSQSCQAAETCHAEHLKKLDAQRNPLQQSDKPQHVNVVNGDLDNVSSLEVGTDVPSIKELCTLVEFLLDVVNVETYTDTPTEHLPELLSMLATLLTQFCKVLTCEEMSLTLQLCSKILGKVQPAAYSVIEPSTDSTNSNTIVEQDTVWNLNICLSPENGSSQNVDNPESLFCISVDTKGAKSQGESPYGHCLLSKCMAAFQNFLRTFVSVRLLQNPENGFAFFEKFILASNSEAERENQLSRLLQQCLTRSSNIACDESKSLPKFRNCKEDEEPTDSILSRTVLKLQSESSLGPAFSVVCQFFTELAAFPVFVVDGEQHPVKQLGSVSCQQLPDWLQLLLGVACFTENVEEGSEVALCALRTVLDLVALTHSVLISSNHSSQKSSPSKDDFSSAPVTSVVHVPVITPSELDFVQNKTRFFSLAAGRLWRVMTEAKQQLRCVELLQQLHNLDADGNACDYVICQAMAKINLQEQLEAQKKFCVLWHLTRDITLKSHPGKCRLFDRPLFLMLDHLCQESGGQRSVAEAWLGHCLQRGDVGRILEPLLLIMLHPDTARVSVQHVNIYCQRKPKEQMIKAVEPEQNAEAQVYAISSVGGNVIYHVSDESKQSSQRSSPERRILALTSVVGSGDKGTQVVTSFTKMDNYHIPCSHDRHLSDRISVFVNPFGSMTSLGSDSNPESSIPDLSTVRRIDTRLITRTYFDDIDSDNDDDKKSEKCVDLVDKVLTNVCNETPDQSAKEEEDFSVEEFVRDLLDNVIASAIEQTLNAGIPEEEPTFPPMEDLLRDFQATREEPPKEYLEHSEDSSSGRGEPAPLIHPLHTYLLLYSQVYDSKQVLYALSSLKSIVLANPRLTLWCLSTTSLSHAQSPRGSDLQVLLSRHRKSVFGNNFHGQLSSESVTTHRSSMLIEVVVLVCLYYVRSFYPSLPQMRLTENEVLGNQAVRLLCVEVLALLFAELVGIVKDSGKSFASYLNDLLLRCKAQKILLHCLIASVYNNNNCKEAAKTNEDSSFSRVVVEYNEKNFEKEGSTFQDTLEVKLLHLLSKLIMLEETVSKLSGADKEVPTAKPADRHEKNKPKFSPGNLGQLTSVKYIQGCPIPGQPIFLTAILSALRQVSRAHLHSTWLSLVMSTLPFAGQSLTQLVISVVSQLSLNLDNLAKSSAANSSDVCWPPDYLVTTVEGLTTICHFCLLDSPTMAPAPQPPHLQAMGIRSSYASGVNASQIIANLLHVFSPSELQKDFCLSGEGGAMVEVVLSVRRTLLGNLPRILSTFCGLWRAAVQLLGKAPNHMGSPKAVKQHILGFLSPISVHYGSHFMAAVAVVWNDYKQKSAIPTRKILPCWSEEQLQLVELISAIKVLPIESVVQTVRQVIRQPPPTSRDDNQKRVPLEVSMLQFFLAYAQHTAGHLLVDSFQALLSLWRDGLQLTSLPLVQFYLLALLHEFVQKAPMLEDKKDQRDLQEVSQKLIDMCSTIAGACLEQTNWLRRNLAVKPGPQQDITDLDQEAETPPIQTDSNFPVPSAASNAQFSVQALQCLAEFLAPIIDVVYVSEEKEKVVYPLNNIMYYVTPYLKNHCCHNVPSFRACSQLLASISDYQYTRKAWKKDAFELLLEPAFFQMDLDCMPYWRAIIDHLMTHDKTTFRDFLARVSLPQSGSLNIFSSKEQEYEQRVQLLKRLAFVLFCSEPDQYQKYMPEIQERLAECLRLPQVPSIQVNVFLCFRVLLLRMSADNMTSLWPTIITEMVQVFLQMEQELSTETEQFSGLFKKAHSSHLQRLSLLDSSWVVNSSNGLHAHNHPAWLQLYLAACKLLDMVVCLPADMLPQFQMYRWAFVGDSPPISSEEELREDQEELRCDEPHFVPHIARLANLMKLRAPQGEQTIAKGIPLVRLPSIQSLFQLQGFFNALARAPPTPQWNSQMSPSHSSKHPAAKQTHDHSIQELIKLLEQVLEMDFVEPQSAS